MNVLAIGCHPDDVEVGCSGTLAKCVKRGDRVIVCHASTGNLGHVVIPPDELIKIRANEAKEAGKLAGIEVICAGFNDLELYDNNKEARDKIVDVIRYANPDFIITQNPDDYMPDHTAISRLVFDASFAATLPNYTYKARFSNPNDPPAKLVPIYYMDPTAGVNFVPEEFVDITEEIDLKLQMLECHASQMVWMRDHDNIDFADFVKTCSRYRGYQCGADYAEGFRMCKAYLKGTTKRFITDIEEYLEKHICDNLNIEQISNDFNCSASMLKKTFQKAHAGGIINYFIDLKIDEAKRMITESEMTISQISDNLGFQSSSYFARIFKKRVGMTPSEFGSSFKEHVW